MGWAPVMYRSPSLDRTERACSPSGSRARRGVSRLPQQERLAPSVDHKRFPHWGQRKNRRCFIFPRAAGFSGSFPPEEIPGVHPQQLGQLGQQGNVGCAPAVFPFGDRLVADAQGLGQGGLGHAFRKAEGADERARLGLVHENRPPFAPDGTTGGDNAQETLRRVGLYRGKLSGIKGPKNPPGGGETAQNLCLEG